MSDCSISKPFYIKGEHRTLGMRLCPESPKIRPEKRPGNLLEVPGSVLPGAERIELPSAVLETVVLPLNQAPVCRTVTGAAQSLLYHKPCSMSILQGGQLSQHLCQFCRLAFSRSTKAAISPRVTVSGEGVRTGTRYRSSSSSAGRTQSYQSIWFICSVPK